MKYLIFEKFDVYRPQVYKRDELSDKEIENLYSNGEKLIEVQELSAKKIVVYKNGDHILCEQSWEYENEPEWLTTIDLQA